MDLFHSAIRGNAKRWKKLNIHSLNQTFSVRIFVLRIQLMFRKCNILGGMNVSEPSYGAVSSAIGNAAVRVFAT